MKIKVSKSNQPTWNDFNVKMGVPQKLEKLEELANNLWWV